MLGPNPHLKPRHPGTPPFPCACCHAAVSPTGDAPQVSKCCWLVSRIMLCCKSDKELREQLHETLGRDGLLGPKAAPAQAAAAWVRVWLAASETEQEAICMMLSARTRLQVG